MLVSCSFIRRSPIFTFHNTNRLLVSCSVRCGCVCCIEAILMMIMHGVLNGLYTRSFIPRVDVILMVSMIAIFYYCNEPFQTIHIIVFLYLLPFTPYALYSRIPLLPPSPFIPTPIPILSRLSLFDPLTPLFPRFPVLETSFRVVFIYSYSLTTLFVSSD